MLRSFHGSPFGTVAHFTSLLSLHKHRSLYEMVDLQINSVGRFVWLVEGEGRGELKFGNSWPALFENTINRESGRRGQRCNHETCCCFQAAPAYPSKLRATSPGSCFLLAPAALAQTSGHRSKTSARGRRVRPSRCHVRAAPLEAASAAQQVRGGFAASQIPCSETPTLPASPPISKEGVNQKMVGRGLLHRGHE